MRSLGQAGEAELHLGGDFGRQARDGGFGDQEALGGDALGIDDLVPVEDQREVIDEAALAQVDLLAVDEVAGGDEEFRGGHAGQALALVEEDAVVLRDDEVALVAERAAGDDHGGGGAHGAQMGAADPADRLAAVVAGEDFQSGHQLLDRALAAVRQGDHRAPCEGEAQEVGQREVVGGGLDGEERVIHSGADRREWQDGGFPAEVEEEELDPVAVGRHQRVAGEEAHRISGSADPRACRDLLPAGLGAVEREAERRGLGMQDIDVADADLVGAGHAVALVGPGRDEDILGGEDLGDLGSGRHGRAPGARPCGG